MSNKFTNGIVKINDSLPTKTLAVSKNVMRQVATIVKTQGNSFKLRLVKKYNLILEQRIKLLYRVHLVIGSVKR